MTEETPQEREPGLLEQVRDRIVTAWQRAVPFPEGDDLLAHVRLVAGENRLLSQTPTLAPDKRLASFERAELLDEAHDLLVKAFLPWTDNEAVEPVQEYVRVAFAQAARQLILVYVWSTGQ